MLYKPVYDSNKTRTLASGAVSVDEQAVAA